MIKLFSHNPFNICVVVEVTLTDHRMLISYNKLNVK